jgi:hypothetical protein
VVVACQQVCAELGWSTLRYNSRGVGLSAGSYDDGQGEQADLRAAVDFMHPRLRSLPLVLLGHSFGAWLALKVGAEHPEVAAIAALGTPVGWAELDFLGRCVKPKLFVHGTRDPYCDPAEMERAFGRMAAPKQLHWIADADHFFTERLADLRDILLVQLPRLLP